MILKENEKIKDISKKYKINHLYYGLDKKDLFKREDRYRYKKTLTAIFGIFCGYNIHEIIFNLYFYFGHNIRSDQIDVYTKFWTEIVSITNLGGILLLSWLTFPKLKIDTKIYY